MEKFKTIDGFMASLSDDKREQVALLRKIIIESEPSLDEHIKWNAPSYALNGVDRITFNVINKQGVVKLVLHMDATRKEDKKGKPILDDGSGLVEWQSDIRGVLSFQSTADIEAKQDTITGLIKSWLAIKP